MEATKVNTKEEFLKELIEHETWITSGGAGGRRMNVTGHTRIIITEKDLKSVGIERPKLRGAIIDTITFKGVDMSDVDMSYMSLKTCVFDKCDLSGAKLNNLHMDWGEFADCRMDKVKMPNSILSNVQFFNCGLGGAVIGGIDLVSVTFEKCRGDGIDITGASGEDVEFHSCEFSRLVAAKVNFIKPGMSDSDLTGADFSEAILRTGALTGVKINDANFSNASLLWIGLRFVEAKNCDFTGAVLKNGFIKDSDLTGAKLEGVTMEVEMVNVEGIDGTAVEEAATAPIAPNRRARREWIRNFISTMSANLGYKLDKIMVDNELMWKHGDSEPAENVAEDVSGPAMLYFSLTWEPKEVKLPKSVTVMLCPDCQGEEIAADWTLKSGYDDPVDMALQLMK